MRVGLTALVLLAFAASVVACGSNASNSADPTSTVQTFSMANPAPDLNKLRDIDAAQYALLGIGERTGGPPEAIWRDSPPLPPEKRFSILADFLPGVQFIADLGLIKGVIYEFCGDGETGYYYEPFGALPVGTKFEWSLDDEIPAWARGEDWISPNTTTVVMQDVAKLYPPHRVPLSFGRTDDSDPGTRFTAHHDNC